MYMPAVPYLEAIKIGFEVEFFLASGEPLRSPRRTGCGERLLSSFGNATRVYPFVINRVGIPATFVYVRIRFEFFAPHGVSADYINNFVMRCGYVLCLTVLLSSL